MENVNLVWPLERSIEVKIPGPKTWLWFAPWKGAWYNAVLLNILSECWSNGVLEKRKPNTEPLVTLNRVHKDSLMHRVYERQAITPILHHSFEPLQAEPVIFDLFQLPARKAYSPEGGTGFLSLIKKLSGPIWAPNFQHLARKYG